MLAGGFLPKTVARCVRVFSLYLPLSFAGLLGLFGFHASAESENSVAGFAAVFEKECGVCHTLSAQEPQRQGPYLGNIINRQLGSVAGFPYSQGLKKDVRLWTPPLLNQWLENPKAVISDTYMLYAQPDPEIRKNIIQYLETLVKE